MEAFKIKIPTISKDTFDVLINNVECDTENDIETIGFVSEWMNYEINFYTNIEAAGKVIIEDFGFMKDKSWVQCTPTDLQIDAMKKLIADKIDELSGIKEEKDHDDFNGDYYDYYGVKREMFF